jgi:regulatory protein
MWDDEEDEDEQQPQRRAPQRKKFKARPEPFQGEVSELTREQLEKFISRLRFTVVWHLNKGDKTRRELEQKLLKKVDIPPELIPGVLDEYEAKNFINDRRYAETFVHSRAEYRKQGKNVIRMELARKGVDREIIDEVLEDWDVDEEVERAKELVRIRMRGQANRKLERQKRTQNLVGMLARKGYPVNVAFSVVKDLLDEEALEEAEEIEGLGEYEEYLENEE